MKYKIRTFLTEETVFFYSTYSFQDGPNTKVFKIGKIPLIKLKRPQNFVYAKLFAIFLLHSFLVSQPQMSQI